MLHAQPILSLTDDRAPRHELLVRLVGDDGDLIPPGSFLDIAEGFDMVQDIDHWVLHEAIGLLATEKYAGRDVNFEVNLSAKSMTDPRLPAFIARELPGSHRSANSSTSRSTT